MRTFPAALSATVLLIAPSLAIAETTVDYMAGYGHSTNIFEDPQALSGPFWEGKLGLRGSIPLGDGKLTYGARHLERRIIDYRFGDMHFSGGNLGYSIEVDKGILIEMETAAVRNSSGDLFLKLPNDIIGYRTTDYSTQTAGKVTVDLLGGKTAFSARYDTERPGTARFTTDLLGQSKLDPDVSLATFGASHFRAAGGGELCFCLEYSRSIIPSRDQSAFTRFPAETLRGSLAYARQFEEGFTLVGEAGMITLLSDDLGSVDHKSEPYLHAEARWEPAGGFEFASGFNQTIVIDDIDDAVGELTQTVTASISQRFHPWVKAGLTFETSRATYYYYLYERKTQALTASLLLGPEKKPQLTIEYTHSLKRETDPEQDYRADVVVARIGGSF